MKIRILFILFSITIQNQICNKGLVSSYGMDGLVFPQNKKMILCHNIELSCCSYQDELKFHKYWNEYYKLKTNKIYDLISNLLDEIAQVGTYFKDFDLKQNIQFIKKTEVILAELLFEKLQQNLFFDSEPLKATLRELKNKDLEIKEQFLCIACDYKSHLKMTLRDQKFVVEKQFCQNLIEKFEDHVKLKNQTLEKMLVSLEQFFNILDIPEEFIQISDNFTKSQFYVYSTEKCFDDEFSFENCRELCEQYSFSNVSEAFFGDVDFYREVVKKWKIMVKFIEDSKKAEEQALQAQINIQKKKQKELKEKLAKEQAEKKDEKKDGEKEGDNEEKNDAEGEENKEEEQPEEEPAARILSSIYRRKRIKKQKHKIFRKKNQIQKKKLKTKQHKRKLKISKKKSKSKLTRELIMSLYKQLNKVKKQKKKLQKENKKQLEFLRKLDDEEVHEENNEEEEEKPQFETEEEAIEYIRSQYDPSKEYDGEELQQLRDNSRKKILIELYDDANRGPLSQFEEDHWISNEVFEGKFFSNFELNFNDLGSKFDYKLTDLFTGDKEKVVEEFLKLEQEETETNYNITPSPDLDYDIFEIVRSFEKDDILSVILDVEIMIGQSQKFLTQDFLIWKRDQENEIQEKLLQIQKQIEDAKKEEEEEQNENQDNVEEENPEEPEEEDEKQVKKVNQEEDTEDKVRKLFVRIRKLKKLHNQNSFFIQRNNIINIYYINNPPIIPGFSNSLFIIKCQDSTFIQLLLSYVKCFQTFSIKFGTQLNPPPITIFSILHKQNILRHNQATFYATSSKISFSEYSQILFISIFNVFEINGAAEQASTQKS